MPTRIQTQPNPATLETTRTELLRFVQRSRPRKRRSMIEFAEQDFTVASGPYKNLPFRLDRTPWARLFLGAIDSGQWKRSALTGPTQGAKTTVGFCIPICYYLFETVESVVAGLPDRDMWRDKWHDDLLPVIEHSIHKRELPLTGAGSRGGLGMRISFLHGPVLRCMTGGGKDTARAGYTSRIAMLSEVNNMEQAGAKSKETDKVGQIEGRTNAYGDRAIIGMECTQTDSTGRINREITAGTDSRIVCPCKHCQAWVTPEREHLTGWQDAESIGEAQDKATFVCPGCGGSISDDDRRDMNLAGRLLHKGQSIDDSGNIVGDAPRTDTLGLRYNGFNNLFQPTSKLAGEAWRASQEEDEENAEKRIRQQYWALPYDPPIQEIAALEFNQLVAKTYPTPRGVAPERCRYLTVGMDVGVTQFSHFVIEGHSDDAASHVIDHGTIDVMAGGEAKAHQQKALLTALRDFLHTRLLPGFARQDGGLMWPDAIGIDSRYMTSAVIQWVKYADEELKKAGHPCRIYAVMGHGESENNASKYNEPGGTGKVIRLKGDNYHIAFHRQHRCQILHINVDHWKTFTHTALATDAGEPGAMTFFSGTHSELKPLIKELMGEQQFTELVKGKGMVIKWRKIGVNHRLDATVYSKVLANLCGARLTGGQTRKRSLRTMEDYGWKAKR